MSQLSIILVSLAYLGILFGIAYYVERSEVMKRRWMRHPLVYALSLGAYCTAWTFFGSVGRAASAGPGFLTVYLGPTIAAPLWVIVLRKIILVSKHQRITSIADFISSRYGKSSVLGILATLIAVLGTIPYISLQLKAISSCVHLLQGSAPRAIQASGLLADPAFYATSVLALFAILFGTRHLDPNERHEGLVAAIAFESVFKLVAFLAVGIFVTFVLFDGFGDLFRQGMAVESISRLFDFEQMGVDGWQWFWLNLISMFAFLLLPRQFHLAVVENNHPDQVRMASWVTPLYLLLINVFVFPIAIAGILLLQGQGVAADDFVLQIPLEYGYEGLAIFVALGGFSAASSMVIVATLALSIMISNNLFLPLVIRSELKETYTENVPGRLLGIRRLSILAILLLAYGYLRAVGYGYSLVSIGLISFLAIAQFAPVLLGGLYWKRATRRGAIAGIMTGFMVWGYTLALPTLFETKGWFEGLFEHGLFGWQWLHPHALFGMDNTDPLSHAAFWSLTLNTAVFIAASLAWPQRSDEIPQADLFVDIYKYLTPNEDYEVLKRQANHRDLEMILNRFLGEDAAKRSLRIYERKWQVDLKQQPTADSRLLNYAETLLTGSLGAASAKTIINSISKTDPISLTEMLAVLEQTQEAIRYSRALEKTTLDLRMANEKLTELDKLKAEFITTVTHELRTPITSIKAFSNILLQNQHLPEEQKQEFLNIVVEESERVGRLINQVLDLEKIQSMNLLEKSEIFDLTATVETACQSMKALIDGKHIRLDTHLPAHSILINGHTDRIKQVLINLLSNAVKFCPSEQGVISVKMEKAPNGWVTVSVADNGIGLDADAQRYIFDKFTQVSHDQMGKPAGSGLGLYICQQIVRQHGGKLGVQSQKGRGATFYFKLPGNLTGINPEF